MLYYMNIIVAGQIHYEQEILHLMERVSVDDTTQYPLHVRTTSGQVHPRVVCSFFFSAYTQSWRNCLTNNVYFVHYRSSVAIF